MIWLFIQNPLWWALPALVAFVVLVLCARFLKETRLYRGEGAIMREPFMVLGMSLMWPLTAAAGIVWCVFKLADIVIGRLIGR